MPASCLPQVQASDENTCQQKRKRRNSNVATEPLRKSQRLLEQGSISSFRYTRAEHSIAKQPNSLPSPSTSQIPPKASGNGRKRSASLLLEDNTDPLQVSRKPHQKRLQTSSSAVSDSISYLVRYSEAAPFGLSANWADIKSYKQPPESEPAAASPILDSKVQLELPGEGLSKKQDVQVKDAIPRTSDPIIKSPEEPAEGLEAQEIEQKERHNPISYWAAHLTWPKSFGERNLMTSSNATNKRQRTSESKDSRSRSYSQSRKEGDAPEQYTAAYQAHTLTKCLDMDDRRGKMFASEESKQTCVELLKIDIDIIESTAIPQDKIYDMIYDCQNRNETIVQRDVTPLIIPSLRLLYYRGANNLKHVVDEVQAIWYQQCVLVGPRPCPDLAIGLFSSAFTEGEIEKLHRYNSVDNWTQTTPQMFFPFLMCEVKCGRESLDMADRQNMHSCSVAVRAILRLEQEADKYRPSKRMDSINGQVLVFSISHDQRGARLYGYYAIVQEEKWTYHRNYICDFSLVHHRDLLAIHSFVQNILKSHLPRHVQRLKDAIAALPDPNELSESVTLPTSSGLSLATSEISLNDDNTRQVSLTRDSDGFVVPPRPTSAQNSRAKKKEQENELARVMQLLEEQREEGKRDREEARREREETKREREEVKRDREELKQQRAQLMEMLKGQRGEANREREAKQGEQAGRQGG